MHSPNQDQLVPRLDAPYPLRLDLLLRSRRLDRGTRPLHRGQSVSCPLLPFLLLLRLRLPDLIVLTRATPVLRFRAGRNHPGTVAVMVGFGEKTVGVELVPSLLRMDLSAGCPSRGGKPASFSRKNRGEEGWRSSCFGGT